MTVQFSSYKEVDKAKQYASSLTKKEESKDSTNKKCGIECLKQIQSMSGASPSQVKSLQQGKASLKGHAQKFIEGNDAYSETISSTEKKMNDLSEKIVSTSLAKWVEQAPGPHNPLYSKCIAFYDIERSDEDHLTVHFEYNVSCKEALNKIREYRVADLSDNPNVVKNLKICRSNKYSSLIWKCTPDTLYEEYIPLKEVEDALEKQIPKESEFLKDTLLNLSAVQNQIQ